MGDEERAERWPGVGNLGADRRSGRLYIYKRTRALRVWQTESFYLSASSVIQVTVQQERCLRTQPGSARSPKVLKAFFSVLIGFVSNNTSAERGP